MKIKTVLACLCVLALCGNSNAQLVSNSSSAKEIKEIRPLADSVKRMAEKLVKSGFTAGDGYAEVWIRDLNTFVSIACEVNNKALIKKHLLTFFDFQQPDGAILDGYVPKKPGGISDYFYYSKLAPNYAGHKNTVETDQETSLIQAVSKYIKGTGDRSILKEKIASQTVQKHLERALEFLLKERFVKKYGLIWGATTVDWGDVQPEHSWGVVLDANSHRTIDIYDNAMLIIAINDFLNMAELIPVQKKYWTGIKNSIVANTRKHLWDEKKQKFIPHIYLEGSPFPAAFNESEIYYHGGTAVAIEAGLLSKDEVRHAYKKMQENVKKANAATIGLTIYPVYPEGFFKNKGMAPYSYQNGGDWTWFGGRMVSQLIRYNLIEEACEAMKPMLDRVVKNKGFYEWYTPDNKPQGSASFRGEAGVLWTAITELEAKAGK